VWYGRVVVASKKDFLYRENDVHFFLKLYKVARAAVAEAKKALEDAGRAAGQVG
jgi:predicted metal-dependent hydrolase